MKKQIVSENNNTGIFLYLILLTSFFLLLEISFFIQTNKVYFLNFGSVSSKIHIPSAIFPDMIRFVVTQLGLHMTYCLLIWLLTFLLSDVIPVKKNSYLVLGVLLWTIGIVSILVANQYYFPNSNFADLTSTVLFNPTLLKTMFIASVVSCGLIVVLASIGLFRLLEWKKSAILSLLITSLLAYAYWPFSPKVNASPLKQPNIIIIGVDSLRPDFLHFFGGDANTPGLDHFLSQATVFGDAVTPLARTFPSWVGILTGRYPKETGIRSDLARQDQTDFSQSLPAILKKQGYYTVFATDETRFSNIDHSLGFDQVIEVPMGLNDFLLGTFNDFPLSNLLVNTKLGKWLFPYSYANRAAFVTYQPNTFLTNIESNLHHDPSKPLFLVVHFCLPHYPYLWSHEYVGLSWAQRYQKTVERASRQVNDYLEWLQEKKILQHAMVILLSDHGEALELPGDRVTDAHLFVSSSKKAVVPHFYPPSLDSETVNQSAGHGTDVLGLAQYHPVFAIRLYGMPQRTHVVPGVVSLLDVKPTVLDLLDQPYDGISLKPVMLGQAMHVPAKRDIFMESDYSPKAIRTLFPEMNRVLFDCIALYRVDPVNLHLVLKDSMAEMVNQTKQLADLYENWILALYPQNTTEQMPILINLETGEWTNDLHSHFAQRSPYLHMLKALTQFYGNEIDKHLG